MTTVLVTGGAGFIGANLVRFLRRERPEWTVVNLDKLTYAGNLESLADLRRDPRHVFVRGDIANAELVEHLCEQHEVDAILNLAAESHVDRSILGPGIFVETNVSGTQVLLGARFALVRPEIRRVRPTRAREPVEPFRALVAPGDDDPHNQAGTLAKQLLNCPKVGRVA